MNLLRGAGSSSEENIRVLEKISHKKTENLFSTSKTGSSLAYICNVRKIVAIPPKNDILAICCKNSYSMFITR